VQCYTTDYFQEATAADYYVKLHRASATPSPHRRQSSIDTDAAAASSGGGQSFTSTAAAAAAAAGISRDHTPPLTTSPPLQLHYLTLKLLDSPQQDMMSGRFQRLAYNQSAFLT
jgi:hypothetical protein